jgi:hypothetical protein
MKKSNAINLVLLTAALSSCSKVVIPNRPWTNELPDSALTNTAIPWDDYPLTEVSPCAANPPYAYYPETYAYMPATIIAYAPTRPYYPVGRGYRKQISLSSHGVVVRQGFGMSAKSVNS